MPYAGNYSVWLERKATRGEGEARAERKKGKAMEEELAWIRQGPKARQSKSKARIARYEEAVEAAREERGREKLLSGAMVIPPGPRLGALVLEVEGLSKTLPPSPGTGGSGEGKVLFKDVTFALPRGGIVGIIGPNGAGKTSLLRCIMGDEGYAADAGAIRFGQTVKVGLVSQSRAELEPNVRVLEAVCGGMDTVEYGPGVEMPARQVSVCGGGVAVVVVVLVFPPLAPLTVVSAFSFIFLTQFTSPPPSPLFFFSTLPASTWWGSSRPNL